MLSIFLFIIGVITAVSADDCLGKPDGSYEAGCRAYLQCIGGIGTLHYCTTDGSTTHVYNSATGRCADAHSVPPPCGVMKDCTGKGDREYPDLDEHCQTYYTCNRGTFFGHNTCPPGTVFDSVLQNCNWPVNVLPPCGTKTTA